ncbi:MAG: hypothetical protein CMD06_01110 [Flavobacteriales bacterium]|nr:hypothetical protein [Flavobacteriales bacterium]|tara:strand:- start:194 stop:451 length:258 start_codon:yes stop_codon:yes gene_type:complete
MKKIIKRINNFFFNKMKKDWLNIIKSDDLMQINIIKGLLYQNGIKSVIVNKQDSSYLMFGEIYLYIQEKDFTTANDIIRKNERNI